MSQLTTRLVKNGNSYGIRLPKAIIDLLELDEKVLELDVQGQCLLVKPRAATLNKAPIATWVETLIEKNLAAEAAGRSHAFED